MNIYTDKPPYHNFTPRMEGSGSCLGNQALNIDCQAQNQAEIPAALDRIRRFVIAAGEVSERYSRALEPVLKPGVYPVSPNPGMPGGNGSPLALELTELGDLLAMHLDSLADYLERLEI